MNEEFYKDRSLKRELIIKKNCDIKELLIRGKKVRSGCLKGFYYQSETFKIAFLVPKYSGKAVYRNNVRRWMKEAFRNNKKEFKFPVKIAFMFMNIEKNITYQNINDDIIRIGNLLKK